MLQKPLSDFIYFSYTLFRLQIPLVLVNRVERIMSALVMSKRPPCELGFGMLFEYWFGEEVAVEF